MEFDSFKYETPDAKLLQIPKKTKLMIITFEKSTNSIVNGYLKNKTPNYLQENNSIFIADIHNVPSFLTFIFILPTLRKYKHTIYLHNTKEFQNNIPNKKGKITLLRFKNEKIIDISFISTKQELELEIQI